MISQNQHGIPTLNEFFDSGGVCELDCVLTSKYEATAAFWLSSSSHMTIMTA